MRQQETKRGTWSRKALGLRLAAVAALAVLSTAGCSFWGAAGGGPEEKEKAYRLYGRAPWTMKSDPGHKRVLESSFQAVPWAAVSKEAAGVAAGKATFRQSSQRYWGSMPLIGWAPGESRILLDKGSGDQTERLIGKSTTFLPGFPVAVLYANLTDTWYSLDRAEELATRCSCGLGPAGVIAGYTRCVQPSDISQFSGNLWLTGPETFGQQLATVAAIKGDEARYNSQWAWHILGGAFGWGRVNYQYFLQIAWLPMPLWRVQE